MLKRYSIAALISLLLIFTAFTGGGFAQETEPDMSPEIEEAILKVKKVNEKIDEEILKVQVKAEKMEAKFLADQAKTSDVEKHQKAWTKYDEKLDAEIAKLQVKAETITSKGIDKAEAAGLEVEIEFIFIKFADREAEIDPIRVLGW
ncbi:hypothetical protein DHX103_05295 [Planococcus sp. X10-3]|uniref:hypothetical protein n=1 Tax=Planococcus sp. X10-3 TaxID=3061240 RepID=UPI003BB0E258